MKARLGSPPYWKSRTRFWLYLAIVGSIRTCNWKKKLSFRLQTARLGFCLDYNMKEWGLFRPRTGIIGCDSVMKLRESVLVPPPIGESWFGFGHRLGEPSPFLYLNEKSRFQLQFKAEHRFRPRPEVESWLQIQLAIELWILKKV